ncbi:helix-turn-helix transcriptional regulator [Streptomyces sp. NPDC004685]
MPSASPPPDWVLARRQVVGSRIKAARLAARMTQETVALEAGIDRPSVVRIEAGQQSPTVDTLIRIAAVLEVDLRDIV